MRRYIGLMILLGLVALPQAAAADEPITWLTFYKTKFGQGGEFVELLKKYDQPVWDRLVAEGAIHGWGIVTQGARTDPEWTYATWVTMPDYAAQLEVERVWGEVMGGRSEADLKVEGDRIRATLEASGTDLIVRHLAGGQAPELPESSRAPSLFLLRSCKARPGRSRDALRFYREALEPALKELAAEGVITHYGFFVQDLRAQPDWTHTLWYRLRDRGAIDRVRQTFHAASEKGEQTLPDPDEIFEPDSHRDMLLSEVLRTTR